MARFECKFISYVLVRSVEITVIVPSVTIPESLGMGGEKPSHQVGERYPVMYLLHGMGNSHTDWCSYSNIEMYAEEHNMAVVMISGENKFYRSEKGGDDFFRFVSEELPEFVTNMFPISKEPEHTYIAGLSMGGYGSLIHGLNHPERFAAIGAFSAAVGVETPEQKEAFAGGPYDPYHLAKTAAAEGKSIPPLYVACGTEDMLYQNNVAYRDFLKEQKLDVTWVEVSGYTHEWRFWDMQVEAFLKWIPRTDGYKKPEVRKI